MSDNPIHPETAKFMLDILRAGALEGAKGHSISRVFVGPAVFAALSQAASTAESDDYRPDVLITGNPNLMPNAAMFYTRSPFGDNLLGESLLAAVDFGDEIKVSINPYYSS